MPSNTTQQSSQAKEAEKNQNSAGQELTKEQLERLKEAEELAGKPISIEETPLSDQQKEKIIEEDIMGEPSDFKKPSNDQKSVVDQPSSEKGSTVEKSEKVKTPQEPKTEISPQEVVSIPGSLKEKEPKLEEIEALTKKAPSSETIPAVKVKKPTIPSQPQIEKEKPVSFLGKIGGFFRWLFGKKQESSKKNHSQPQKESEKVVEALKKGEPDAASKVEETVVAVHPDDFQTKREKLQPNTNQKVELKSENENKKE